jgi:peptide/nickel transport system ATP-binding protein
MGKLLEVQDLKKHFKVPNGLLHAVDGVSFSVDAGKTLGVVGESGCGKSTLGRVILGLIDATAGHVVFDGKDITNAGKDERFALRKDMQIIFQDPFSSLNPRMCVRDIIAEPLIIYNVFKSESETYNRVSEIMDTVGLAQRLSYAYPHELDGGRRQRIGVGRALALNPRFIVCDEPVSALDVSIQAQILNLMQDLQEEKSLTYVFITHDLSVVKHISDDILVMYLGCMVEKCSSNDLFKRQLHPYTKGLISAIPVPKTKNRGQRILLSGELTSPINPQPGCRFASRCPYAKERCGRDTPVLSEVLREHFVACHYVAEINNL